MQMEHTVFVGTLVNLIQKKNTFRNLHSFTRQQSKTVSVIPGQSGRRQCTLILSHSVLTWELRFFSLSRLFRLPNGSIPFIPSIPHRVMNDSSLYDWHCSMNSFNKQINITFHYIILKNADEWCVARESNTRLSEQLAYWKEVSFAHLKKYIYILFTYIIITLQE